MEGGHEESAKKVWEAVVGALAGNRGKKAWRPGRQAGRSGPSRSDGQAASAACQPALRTASPARPSVSLLAWPARPCASLLVLACAPTQVEELQQMVLKYEPLAHRSLRLRFTRVRCAALCPAVSQCTLLCLPPTA